MRAIQVGQYGGAEVLVERALPIPEPGPEQALIKIDTIGVNYIDVYHRTGRYPVPLPFTPGQEAAGTIAAVGAVKAPEEAPAVEADSAAPTGERIGGFRLGDRVAWANHLGAYAEYAVVPLAKLIPLPDDVSFEQGAALMLQGLTAHYLVTDTFTLRPGHTALVHAGAGGLGLLLTQMAKRRGARVFTTVSTEAKALLSHEAGADEVILYTQKEFKDEVRRLTSGAGVDVVYDSVGKTTFEKSLDSLRPRGMLVLYGASSGAVPAFDPQVLSAKGSLFLTRPSLGHYVQTRDELLGRAAEILGWLRAGELKLRIDRQYPLRDAAQAHRDLEARTTTGKVVLTPS